MDKTNFTDYELFLNNIKLVHTYVQITSYLDSTANMHTSSNDVGYGDGPFVDWFTMFNFMFSYKIGWKIC